MDTLGLYYALFVCENREEISEFIDETLQSYLNDEKSPEEIVVLLKNKELLQFVIQNKLQIFDLSQIMINYQWLEGLEIVLNYDYYDQKEILLTCIDKKWKDGIMMIFKYYNDDDFYKIIDTTDLKANTDEKVETVEIDEPLPFKKKSYRLGLDNEFENVQLCPTCFIKGQDADHLECPWKRISVCDTHLQYCKGKYDLYTEFAMCSSDNCIFCQDEDKELELKNKPKREKVIVSCKTHFKELSEEFPNVFKSPYPQFCTLCNKKSD